MKAGDKVYYVPFKGCDPSQYENGIIKRETPLGYGFFVVYNCAGNWHRIEDYTAANTPKEMLKRGWHRKARNANQ
jgi:hypothetical protein